MSKAKPVRFDDPLREAIEAYAKENGMDFSSAVRWLAKQGLLAVRSAEAAAVAPRRRVLSPGVG